MPDLIERLRDALAGTYDIEREIGKGGSAIVYLAHDVRHDRQVALKVLRPELTVSIANDRFLREIGIAARLQHPNIVPLHDSGEVLDLPYFVMPYLEGETLRRRMKREKQFPLDEVVRVTHEVADALTYAHTEGVIHRDIKPENIVVTREHAVVADFGIAKSLVVAGGEELTDSSMAIGTPAYMSPEQGVGDTDLDSRSDLYSLGCVAFEMLAGEPPFTGATPQAVIARHVSEHPPSAQIVRPSISDECDKVMTKVLAKVPADRFKTAVEFADALEQSLSEKSTPISDPPRPEWRKRLPVVVGVAAVAAIAVALLWPPAPPPLPPLDSNRIMVFTLVDRRADAGEEGAGEDVAIMIGNALSRTDPLRWIDGWDWMSPTARADISSLSMTEARSVARSRGAGYAIDGWIVSEGDSNHVILRLHDLAGDSLLARSNAGDQRAGVSLPELGRRAVARLLPAIVDVGRAIDSDPLATYQPAAVADWLQGEREYRRSNFPAALELFRTAVELDSTLALAALRGAQAASWKGRPWEASDFVDAALRVRSALSNKELSFARGLRHYYDGKADSAKFELEQALAVDPEWSDAWMLLGEVHYHLFPTGVKHDSAFEAAFKNALAHDNGFTPPLMHLSEIAVRRGDVAEASGLVTQFEQANPDPTLASHLNLMLECVSRGPGDIAWAEAARRSTAEVLEAGAQLAVSAAQPACAEHAFRAIVAVDDASTSHRWSAFFGLQNLLFVSERYDELKTLLDEHGEFPTAFLYLIDAAAGAPMWDEAETAAHSLGTDFERMSATRLWTLGVWAAKRSDSVRVTEILEASRNRADSTGTDSDSLLVEVMRAWLAVARGDSSVALERLDNLAPVAPGVDLGWDLWNSLGAERLLQAQLLMADDRYDEALQVAAALDHPQPMVFIIYVPASLSLRAAAAQRLGLDAVAREYSLRLSSLTNTQE